MAKTMFNRKFMNTTALLCAFVALPLLTGCAVPLNKTIAQPQATVPASQKVTIAVLPFETVEQRVELSADEDKNGPQATFDKNVRNFEKKYFAARLVETLAKSPWVQEVYISPVMTPSVDYLVKGGIIESDGEDTTVSITLTRCCWKDVHSETFSMDLASSHFEEMWDPGSQLWIDPVNKIGEILAKVTPDQQRIIEEERAASYLKNKGKPFSEAQLSPRVRKTIQTAAAWERAQLLGRVSKMTMGFADRLGPTYVMWQQKSTKQWEEKRQKDLQTAVSVFAALTSFGAGMASASMGVTSHSQALSYAFGMNVASAMESSQEAAIIAESLSQFAGSFGETVEPQTFQLGDQVYTLTGSMDARIAQLRDIVRKEIIAESERYASVGH
jgi:hypothetical protein